MDKIYGTVMKGLTKQWLYPFSLAGHNNWAKARQNLSSGFPTK